jgi:hypothetical protein
MRRALLGIAGLFPCLLLAAAWTCQAHETASSPAARVYYGAYVPGSHLPDFEQHAGKKVSLVLTFPKWGDPKTKNRFDKTALDSVRRHGAIPVLTWEPWDARKGFDETKGLRQPQFALRKIIEGKHDDYIIGFANDARNWGHPFFLRFAHEMNGAWYPWAEKVNGNHKGEYVAAWRHVYRLFRKQGALNATWVWSPACFDLAPFGLKELYPGDDCVDWVGLDGYNDTRENRPWRTFSEVFGHPYRLVTKFAHNKPVMIAETGSMERGGDKARWITDALSVQLPRRFPQVRALVWFDVDCGRGTDWRIESSSEAQRAFASAIRSPLFGSNGFSSLDMSPIPPLR